VHALESIELALATTNEENLDEKLHAHDHACTADRSGDLPNGGRSLISEPPVAERRRANGRHQFRPTAAQRSRQLVRSDNRQPTILGQATTNDSGEFSIRYTRSTSHSIFFVQADAAEGVEFITILGPNLPASVIVNELTTVAASYSMAQFLRTGVISGNSFGLQIAAGMNDNIVAFATGQSSPVLLSSPNADQTNSLRSTRSLANLLAACVDDPDVTASLFDLTTPPGGLPPHNTAEALANLARDPGQNVDGIFALTLLSDLYDPPLVTMPDAWTVTVKINDSGSDEPDRLISGPGNIAFDRRGYAWVTNNTVQGTPCSGRFNLVFRPNGQPADGTNGTPRSPLTGGGVLGAGYGVTIDNHSVWFGNFGWGDSDHCSPTPIPSPSPGNGSVSHFTRTGMPVSPPDAYQGGPVRAQGMAADADGNIWISSFGNNSVFVFKHGNPHQSVGFDQQFGGGPFDIAIAADGSAWVTNGLGLPPATIAKIRARQRGAGAAISPLVGQPTQGYLPRFPGKCLGRLTGRWLRLCAWT
jgi:hypothetical protein